MRVRDVHAGYLTNWALRSRFGLTAIDSLCGFGGFAVVIIQLWLTGVFGRLGDASTKVTVITFTYLVIASICAIWVTMWMQQRYLGWIRQGRPPTEAEARRVLRLPMDLALLSSIDWPLGLILEAILLTTVAPESNTLVALSLVAVGGLASTGFKYLVIDRMLRTVIPTVAEVVSPASHPSTTVVVRLGVTWALASGLPLVGMVLALSDSGATPHDRIRGALVLAVGTLIGGCIATAALARSVADPLHSLRNAVQRIGHGDLDVTVPVSSTSEIGMLEASVNDMTQNLRDGVRMRELFGRHVGANVVDRAVAQGYDLTGEMREVSALFVDVVGSTSLAHRLEPQEFVDKLNRLLTIVVAATTENGGLVNKFEGDAALCIFGAPIAVDDDATHALRAARRIRDAVLDAGELDIGVGVARGLVFAGDVGSDTRLEYTVIGDAVNEAARLTDAAKSVDQRILVSQAVIEAVRSGERDLWAPHGVLTLRGREDTTRSWTDNRGHRQAVRTARSSSTVETGRSQTKPRHTYTADAPPTSGRSASNGIESGSPTTTTAPPGDSRRATAASSDGSGPVTTAT